MKNSQKGFALVLIIAMVAILTIGGGVYIYLSKEVIKSENKSDSSKIENDTAIPSKSTSSIHSLPFDSRTGDSLSVAERQQYYDALLKLDPNTIFTLWKKFEEQNDEPRRQGFVSIALSDKLTMSSENINAPVYKNIASFLTDGNNKIGSKIYLVKILGQAETAPSLQILLDVSNSQKNSELLIEIKISIMKLQKKLQ